MPKRWEPADRTTRSGVAPAGRMRAAPRRRRGVSRPSDDAAAAWDRMSDRERQAYFKKVERLNKKSSKNRLKKRVPRPIKEMKLKPLLTENKDLVWAISYLEKGKDALYSYIKDDDRARREARRYFPIDDFLSSVKQNEGKEIADSDIEKIIMKLDDIILSIADSNRENN